MWQAIIREVSPAITRCELAHLPREPIDVDLARAQHGAYERCLGELGCSVQRIEVAPNLPDSVFVEDIAVVVDELAVITRPGATSRRAETPAVAAALGAHRPLRSIEPPATLDGGDVLLVGRQVFVGRSVRTNATGIEQLRNILGPYGYAVTEVPVHGCLHLKSAVTAVSEDTVLINRRWVPAEAFGDLALLDVDEAEPLGANALLVGNAIVYPSAFPRTRGRLEARGLRVRTVDVGELMKAEGAVTCCSLIVKKAAPQR